MIIFYPGFPSTDGLSMNPVTNGLVLSQGEKFIKEKGDRYDDSGIFRRCKPAPINVSCGV